MEYQDGLYTLNFIREDKEKITIGVSSYRKTIGVSSYRKLQYPKFQSEFKVLFSYVPAGIQLQVNSIEKRGHVTFYIDQILPTIEEKIKRDFDFSFSEDERCYIKEYVHQSYLEIVGMAEQIDKHWKDMEERLKIIKNMNTIIG